MLFKSFFLLSVCRLFVLAIGLASGAHASDAVAHVPEVDFAGQPATEDTRIAAYWVAANADNQRLPFVIVDKKNAQAFVFDADRKLKGVTPVLLGLAWLWVTTDLWT